MAVRSCKQLIHVAESLTSIGPQGNALERPMKMKKVADRTGFSCWPTAYNRQAAPQQLLRLLRTP